MKQLYKLSFTVPVEPFVPYQVTVMARSEIGSSNESIVVFFSKEGGEMGLVCAEREIIYYIIIYVCICMSISPVLCIGHPGCSVFVCNQLLIPLDWLVNCIGY